MGSARTTESWIRNAKVHCNDGWWDMRMSVRGVASSTEWVMEIEAEGEPPKLHRGVPRFTAQLDAA